MMPSFQNIKNSPADFIRKHWHLFALSAIALLAFCLDFAAISKVGYGNAYYAAAVESMSQSLHNFFFVSFDPAGVVSVDKPPLGLWVQTVFTLVFGYHGWAMLLPQALSATGAAIMMYVLTAKHFGRPAGLVSALVFALTPAVVAAARNNTMDMQLVFVLEIAAWFLFRSLETSKWRYLFICAVLVGLGFNIKMLQAYMILPAVVLVYLIFARGKFLKRLAAGGISLVIMAAVSFAWVLAVDLTPADQRPYVGSSTDNTVMELIIGHNGMERLYGGMGRQRGNNGGGFNPGGGAGDDFGGQMPGAVGGGQNGAQNPDGGNFNRQDGGNFNGNAPAGQNQDGQNSGGPMPGGDMGGNGGFNNRPGGGPGGGAAGGGTNSRPAGGMDGGNTRGAGGSDDIGTPGALRLWTQSLYGQASWLILLALFCILVKLGKPRLKDLNIKHAIPAFWSVWLITMLVFFSFAGFYHRYYLCMFAPGLAGLIGIGFPEMVKAFREKRGWKQFLLPAAFIAAFTVEIVFVWGYEELRSWLAPLMLAAAAAALLLMILNYIRPKRLIVFIASGFTLLSLLIAPFYWSLTVVLYVEQNATLPYAGPELADSSLQMGGIQNQQPLTTLDDGTRALEEYLVDHYTEGSYLVVAQRANDVAQFIVDTGLPAVAYGGFLGSDDAITLERFQELVAEGRITYFLMSSQTGGSSEIADYVRQNAAVVDASEYLGSAQAGSAGQNGSGGGTLYKFGA